MTIGQNAENTKRDQPIARAIRTAVMAGALLAVAAPAWADPAQTYYERSFVLAADARCDLFQPRVNAALTAAAYQARGAALRSGAAHADLSATAARARSRAASISCANPDLKTVRARVDHAFAGWSRMPRMDFEGWSANRGVYSTPTWRLMQASASGAAPVQFGFGGTDPVLSAVVSFPGKPRPVAARVVMRDAALLPRPWLLNDTLPPASVRTSLWATGVAPADQGLLTAERRSGEAWRFPAHTTSALAALDPREPFLVEFHFRDGSVATARFTAGDFSAGRAFLAMGAL
ncbi:hypothetical protein [uncultured Brevundimonas sp.]|uniref:hypothetical protein n=1 Tax=uncultured Brevundimonas sp. TaxID=213418 RepID=UPI0025D8CB84|nr:hypothetical protein [uncultured Brevundimonas sp.]